jgi:hypothetical protein
MTENSDIWPPEFQIATGPLLIPRLGARHDGKIAAASSI